MKNRNNKQIDPRRRKTLPLGWRWLSEGDVFQAGDEIDLNEAISAKGCRWERIQEKHPSLPGMAVTAIHMIFTPRGSRLRTYNRPLSQTRAVWVALVLSALCPVVAVAICIAWWSGWHPLWAVIPAALVLFVCMLPGFAMTLKGIRKMRSGN